MLLFSANFWVTKECEAPQSNNTVAGVELTRNVPSMMSKVFLGLLSGDLVHTSFAIVGLIAGSGVPWWCSATLSLVGRIGAQCIWLLFGTLPREVSSLAKSKARDLSKVIVGVVPS